MIMSVYSEDNFSVIYNGETIAPVDGMVEMLVTSPDTRHPVTFAVVGIGYFTLTSCHTLKPFPTSIWTRALKAAVSRLPAV